MGKAGPTTCTQCGASPVDGQALCPNGHRTDGNILKAGYSPQRLGPIVGPFYRWDTRTWWRLTPNGLREDRSITLPAPQFL